MRLFKYDALRSPKLGTQRNFRVQNVWGSTRPPKLAKFTTALFAFLRVEIVPNSTHFQNGTLWVRRLENPEKNRLGRQCIEFYEIKKEKYCVANEVR